MSQPIQALSSNLDERILLAIQALKQCQFTSIQATAKAYNIPWTTLQYRIDGELLDVIPFPTLKAYSQRRGGNYTIYT